MPGVIYRPSCHFRWGHAAFRSSQLPSASASRSLGETPGSEGLGGVGVLLASASPSGQGKFCFSQHEGLWIIPARDTSPEPPSWPQVMGNTSGVAMGQRWHGGTRGVQRAEDVTPREHCVTHPPPAEAQGIFANQSSTLLHGKNSPRMSHHPLPHPLERQKVHEQNLPMPRTPPAPALRNTAGCGCGAGSCSQPW